MVLVDPAIVLLDEPTAGMTSDETRLTGEIIKIISQDQSVVVIEHDMEFVKQIAQRIVVLHQGEKLTEGSVTRCKIIKSWRFIWVVKKQCRCLN